MLFNPGYFIPHFTAQRPLVPSVHEGAKDGQVLLLNKYPIKFATRKQFRHTTSKLLNMNTLNLGPKRDEVTGGWRKLHNEELQSYTLRQV
jgi:hypothetical protein